MGTLNFWAKFQKIEIDHTMICLLGTLNYEFHLNYKSESKNLSQWYVDPTNAYVIIVPKVKWGVGFCDFSLQLKVKGSSQSINYTDT